MNRNGSIRQTYPNQNINIVILDINLNMNPKKYNIKIRMKHVSIMWELQIYVRQYLESPVNSKHDCS